MRVNDFLASAKMRNRADTTNRDYAYSIGVWLNFLLALGRNWWEATDEDVEAFQFWRITDPANEQAVQESSFARDMAGCKTFYRWIGKRHPVRNPFEDRDPPRGRKRQDVKWLDPAAVDRWISVGVRGRGLDGRVDPAWRGRNEQRDTAFVNGLYGTGLRLSSWSSVVLPELPVPQRGRGYYRCQLADECAKGRYGYRYWMPRAALRGVIAYIEGAPAAAVRRAQDAGRYEHARHMRLVTATTRTTAFFAGRGERQETDWNNLGPDTRRLLFRRTPQGLEPLALWLNEDGLPRAAHGWHHTFDTANARIRSLGLDGFTCTPHILRHSLALKWFAVGQLVQAARLGHLSEDEVRDFREQFGDVWSLVQTILGHRRVETTREVYLEPFEALQVEVLLAHAEGFPIARFISDAFAGHPRVRTDPLAVGR
ncbi:site-specific integrase [Embleya sp. NPDC059237]|uniref:site-specific integrase n=1 Tax=Embleya sp. NPDC059237 TaxID=3346784 RepID=UPI003682BA2D